jgi:CheY-like chemotaxis protein
MADREPPMNTTRGRILVIDDHETNLKLARTLLSAEGFEVTTAVNATSALEAARATHPELVLADIQLPDMDGLELTRRLKRDPETADIVVVALTAYAMPTDEQQAMEAGCDGYIAKPIDTRTLGDTLERFIREAT